MEVYPVVTNNIENTNTILGSVMVVGAGITGIQTALDLADTGYKVYLVERSPAIGGHMPMLDKTFPTNDCSMCILSPKVVECGKHRNIEILTQSEIVEINGEPGNFKASVLKKSRFVDPDKCLGCGACAEVCPVKIPSEFDQKLGIRRAIYRPYPQAYPNAFAVDSEKCLRLKNPKACGRCLEACPVEAIDHNMPDDNLTVNIGAIVLCPGLELFNPELKGEYGYGIYPNVITSLQFERMLSASGPFGGHLERISDGGKINKVAFIQCVGSRDTTINQGYCSSVCCMYATKEALIAKEHQPGLETKIFCIDVRAFGKDFEKYYNRAKDEQGVQYIKSSISSIKELQQSKQLRLQYHNSDNQIEEEDFDLVVLSVGLKPTKGVADLARIMDIPLNHYNFCATQELSGVNTMRPGVYVAGAFSGPKDIPESVMQASAAAGQCASFLSSSRNTLVTEKTYPAETEVAGQDPRIGVIVCRCGTNIASVVDVPAVTEIAGGLENVAYAQETMYACSQDSLDRIKDLIKEHNLNRVVVASCSPRTHRSLFQDTLRDAGLNKQLFEMANIRDQCSWVHRDNHDKATTKATDLMKMAVSKAATLKPTESVIVGVTPSCLILGGGISGISAALCLADQGYLVHLVENTEKLGGLALKVSEGFNGEDIQKHLAEKINAVTTHPLIKTYYNSTVTDVSGYIGNYSTTLNDGSIITHGAAIIATGGNGLKPEEYQYGQTSRVLNHADLEEAFINKDSRLKDAQNIVMIQCVGSRDNQRPYCSRVCCTRTMKMALKIKKINPEANITVLYRDIRTYGFKEDLYYKARSQGVVFVEYSSDSKPEVSSENQQNISVSFVDPVLKEMINIDADLLVLAEAIIPAESNNALSKIFKVPLNADGFFLEAHVKLRPVDSSVDGIYICGLAHGPKSMEGSITQGKAAAGRASTLLSRKTLESQGVVAVVDKKKCAACLTCVRLCPYGAPKVKNSRVEIEAVLCHGCGSCAGECPNKAITLQGYSDEQYDASICGMFND
ncbi:MAG: CoB--CoM heterodisulfide reductase iron-sulfur subunit A family protein [Peptococcaceae bacterium]|nr:CoB--CoM heterodisulfide reductase iron-sulfur subunit A family protein [Peptococcaceae bacterium]